MTDKIDEFDGRVGRVDGSLDGRVRGDDERVERVKRTSTTSLIFEMYELDGQDLRIRRTRRSFKMKMDGRDRRFDG